MKYVSGVDVPRLALENFRDSVARLVLYSNKTSAKAIKFGQILGASAD
jgi:hypothetical protein